MELRLEIKLASVEELAGVAKALNGLHVGEVKPATRTTTKTVVKETVEESEPATEEEYEEVPSPFSATAGQPVKEEPKAEAKPAAASKKQTAAEAKAAKKAHEEAERAERVARLKASMEANKEIADQALSKSNDTRETATVGAGAIQEEPVEAIVNEIKSLGDQLMAFTGMTIEAKQALTAQVMAKVGVPQGVRPTQLQQPMLGQFRDMYRAAVSSVVNPVMGGLV